MMQRLGMFFLLFYHVLSAAAQTPSRVTLMGHIRDAETGEELVGASIIIKATKTTGAITNSYGFYSLTVASGQYDVVVQYIGYESIQTVLTLDKNVSMNFTLSPITSELTEVVVSSERKDERIHSSTMGVEKIDLEEISKIPVILGERDIIKSLQLLPGVKSSTEGSSGFFVRGGVLIRI